MTKSRHNNLQYWQINVGPGLIEYQHLETKLFHQSLALQQIVTKVIRPGRIKVGSTRGPDLFAGNEIWLVLERRGFPPLDRMLIVEIVISVTINVDHRRYELIHLGQRTLNGDVRVEVRGGRKNDVFGKFVGSPRDGDHRWNSE